MQSVMTASQHPMRGMTFYDLVTCAIDALQKDPREIAAMDDPMIVDRINWFLTDPVCRLRSIMHMERITNVNKLYDGDTALALAIRRGCDEIIDVLLENTRLDTNKAGKADELLHLEYMPPRRATPLTLAVAANRVGLVDKLLQHPRTNLHKSGRGAWHVQPLNVACELCLVDMLQHLLAHERMQSVIRCMLDRGTDLYFSTLLVACLHGHVDCVRVLIAHDDSVFLRLYKTDDARATPIHVTVAGMRQRSRGAIDKTGTTIIEMLVQHEHFALNHADICTVVELFCRGGIDQHTFECILQHPSAEAPENKDQCLSAIVQAICCGNPRALRALGRIESLGDLRHITISMIGDALTRVWTRPLYASMPNTCAAIVVAMEELGCSYELMKWLYRRYFMDPMLMLYKEDSENLPTYITENLRTCMRQAKAHGGISPAYKRPLMSFNEALVMEWYAASTACVNTSSVVASPSSVGHKRIHDGEDTTPAKRRRLID